MNYSNHELWHSVKTNPPANGQCVAICYTNGEKDKDFWTTDIAYYCDDAFYKLGYDSNLGVMRKQFIPMPDYWAGYIFPPFDD